MTAINPPLPGAMAREVKRKLFHYLSLVYAAGYVVMGLSVLKILIPVLLIEASVEFGRFLFPEANRKLMGLFGGIHREEESHRASGIFWTLLGSTLTVALFRDRAVVLCSMGYLVFGDSAAALAGVKWGRRQILPGKSVEGSAAFFIASLAVGLYFFPPPAALAGALLATCVEMLPLPWNDNFWVPLVSAVFLSLLKNAF